MLVFSMFVCLLVMPVGCSNSDGHDHSGHSHDHGDLEPRLIEDNPPTIDIEILGDPRAGYRVRLNTTRFKITDSSSSGRSDGDTFAGHAHLYINDEMTAMFYDDEYQLPLMEPGRYKISVLLSDLDHRPLKTDESLVQDTAVITIDSSH